MNQVAIRGVHPDNTIQHPTITVTVPGGRMSSVVTAPIDIFGERVTRRTVVVKKTLPMTLSGLFFKLDLETPYNDPERKAKKHTKPKLPQKHIVDFRIEGANGPNGFIPAKYDRQPTPVNLKQIFTVKGYDSMISRNISTNEIPWWEDTGGYPISFDGDSSFNSNYYTAGQTIGGASLGHIMVDICNGTVGPGQTPFNFSEAMQCHMFYSYFNIVILRATLDLYAEQNEPMGILTLEKITRISKGELS